MQAIKITPAFAILLQTNSWVIINQDYAVGAYKSRQAARDAKALNNLEGSIKNKSEVEVEVVDFKTELNEVDAKLTAEAAPVVAEPEPTFKPYGFESHGLYNCPHCGIGLDNGVLQDGDEGANGAPNLKMEKYEYYCMACGGEFGPELKPVAPKAPKLPKASTGPILHKSEIDHPCKRVWGIASDMKAANPNIKRGEVLAACVAQGIAYYTARTQYQQWLGIQKEMADREAAQAAAKV